MERGRGTLGRIGRAARRFARDEGGATAIEYGLIAALVAVVIIAAAKSVGLQLNATFRRIALYL